MSIHTIFPVLGSSLSLPRALKLARGYCADNPERVLLRLGENYYWPHFQRWNGKWHYNGRVSSVKLNAFLQPEWSGGWAWVDRSHADNLVVDLNVVSARAWEVLDIGQFPLDYEDPGRFMGKLLDRWDKDNRYQYNKSPIVLRLVARANKELETQSSPWRVSATRSRGYDSLSLEGGDSKDYIGRGIATRLMRGLIATEEKVLEEAKQRAIYDKHAPLGPLTIERVGMEEFLRRVQASKQLWHLDGTNARKFLPKTSEWVRDWGQAILRPVRLERDNYGGARTDRLAIRNRITNEIGLPKASGREFYSLNDVEGSCGTFFADVVEGYGPDGESILLDGNTVLALVDERQLPDPASEVTMLMPRVGSAGGYKRVRNVLQKRLASFESWSAR